MNINNNTRHTKLADSDESQGHGCIADQAGGNANGEQLDLRVK